MITESENGGILSHASQGLNADYGNRNHYYANYHQDVVDNKDVIDTSQQSMSQIQNLNSLQQAQLLQNYATYQ